MQTLNIKTHRSDQRYSKDCFYILSKGNNAGKPLLEPCANCFVVFVSNEEEKHQMYWLCYGLWQAKAFQPYQVGSVIMFIRIDDLKKLLTEAYQCAQNKPKQFMKTIKMLQQLKACEERLMKQTELIKVGKGLAVRKLIAL